MGDEHRLRNKEGIEEDVERLKEWLYNQPHLPHDVEPELLSVFVQGTESLDNAKNKLDGYYSTRHQGFELFDFKNRDPTSERFKEFCKASEQFILPKTTPDGCRVFIKLIKWEHFDHFDHPNIILRMMMMLELSFLRWPDNPGFYGVLDLKDIPVSGATKLRPLTIASFINCHQGGYPLRLKGMYVTNAAPFIEDYFSKLYKPFINDDIFKVITITSKDISAFYDFIPQDILPCDFGGGKEKPSAELSEYWLNQLIENRSWFEHTSKQMSDETKRPPDGSNTYGYEGTFRKLELD